MINLTSDWVTTITAQLQTHICCYLTWLYVALTLPCFGMKGQTHI